jgi:ankyrin repeat protein
MEVKDSDNIYKNAHNLEMFLDFLIPQKRRNKAFHEACDALDMEKVQALLATGADINCHDENGNTALMFQVYKGDERIEFVRFLLSNGANPNLPSKGDQPGITPIHTACAVGANECLAALIAYSASLHWTTPDGSEAIHSAAIGGNASTVKLLVKAGANINVVNEKKRTALHNCLITKNMAVTKALIKAGAELEIRDEDGATILFKSVCDESVPFVKLFLDSGANPEVCIESNDLVMYPLQTAVMSGNLKLVQLLVEAGCNVEKKYPGTFTLLQAAEHKGFSKIVSYLKENVQLVMPEGDVNQSGEKKQVSAGMVRFKVTDDGRLEQVN